MKNPFLESGALDTVASVNKVIIAKMPTDIVKQDLIGKAAIDIFSTRSVIEEIKNNASRLKINLCDIEEKMLPYYLEERLLGEDREARKAADEILRMFGERLAVILLCLKMGEAQNRIARSDWKPQHWEFWRQLKNVILVGGLANSYLGESLKYHVERVFLDAGQEGYRLILGQDSAYAGLRGCTQYLRERRKEEVNLVFDFGQTFTKRSFAQFQDDGMGNIRVLDNMLSRHVEWDVDDPIREQREAEFLNDSFCRILFTTIAEVKELGYAIGREIIISIANYVQGGRLANRGGYGKLRLIASDYAGYLTGVLQNKYAEEFTICLIHDGTAMAAGYREYPDSVCLSLGTAFGVGFPENVF